MALYARRSGANITFIRLTAKAEDSISLETMATFEFGWIAQIFVRNLVLMFIVAGGLYWFFSFREETIKRAKFDGC